MTKKDMKELHEFHTREEWVEYAMSNMRKIEAQRREENGVEILLVRRDDIIGKWSDQNNFGYIEEYRAPTRLEKERTEEDED
ncbi:MAG: hypothetical protein HKP09_05375 [Enterobacterales bacterium]|nr:hypothetical protein [Enterobacterales bacterium]